MNDIDGYAEVDSCARCQHVRLHAGTPFCVGQGEKVPHKAIDGVWSPQDTQAAEWRQRRQVRPNGWCPKFKRQVRDG